MSIGDSEWHVVALLERRTTIKTLKYPNSAVAPLTTHATTAFAWIAHPQGRVARHRPLSRDALRQLPEDKGVRPVRQIALDATWSALRFRPA